MTMEHKYCNKCGTLVAKLEAGSMVRKNTIMTCDDCHVEKKYDSSNNMFGDNAFGDLFNDIFKNKK